MALKASTAATVATVTIRENSQVAGATPHKYPHCIAHRFESGSEADGPLSLATYIDPLQFGQCSIRAISAQEHHRLR